MARIAIAAYGSRGDLVPLTDIGCHLREAGHEVVMTATPDLLAEVTACGLTARPVDLVFDREIDPDKPMAAAMELILPRGMRKLGETLLAALDDVPADILLLSPFAELAGHPLAEARGIPSIGVRLQPLSTTAAFPPSLLGAWSAGPIVNRAAGRLATAIFDRTYAGTVAHCRDRLGLPPVSQRRSRRDRTNAEWPILHGFSPSIVPRPEDWRPGLEVTGYWWPRRPIGWEPPNEVVTFLESGSAPVYLGLGSLMMSESAAARTSEIIGRALHLAGVRGIVQSGGAGLNVTDADILTIGALPHDWLFPRVAAAAHSCGAGTTAAALRAGIPTIPLPSPGGDQPFWARRLRALGVSPAPIPRPKLTPERLARAVDSALTTPAYRSGTQRLAARIAEENGAARAADAVEKLLG